MASMEGKVIAITGAASGIGFATASLLASRGAVLSLADINSEALESAVKSIQEATPAVKLHYQAVDIADSKSVDEWLEAIIKEYGRLDGAANIAGVVGELGKMIVDISDEAWNKTLDVNLKGLFFCLRAELRKIQDKGSIVNTASIAGFKPAPGMSPYGASKHGVISLTKSAAMEVGHRGIRVNCIAPGPTDTPMTASLLHRPEELQKIVLLGRPGQPEEMAKLVAFLLSEESSFTTGSVYVADGGYGQL